ncbi:MAG: protein kinase domain-containing protein [Ktedonobacterales bacterium]
MAGLQGRAFGGYQLTEHLNSGGIAEAYRAQPAKPGGREVVVKVIYPEFARQPGFIPHFRKIVQMSGKLASHPHILPLLAHGEENGYLYLVTPYVAAGTLRDWMQKGGRLGATDVGPFFRQLGDALSYAHSLGVIHGNMKPSNVFLFEGRHVLLGDFGMLWDISHMDMNHAGSGTEAVEYLAPEVANGQVTQLGDVYSVGTLLFASITGQAPFHGAKPADVFAAHAHMPVPQIAQLNPMQPPAVLALDAVIQRAMAKRPEDRFPSVGAVAQAIETTLRQAPATPATVGSTPFGSMPFGSMPLGGMGSGSVNLPSSHPGANPLSAAAAGMATGLAGMAGMAAGMAAPGIPGMPSAPGMPAAGPQLRPLDPPFPPLPPTEQIDEHMEQGRIPGGTIPTMRVAAPPIAPPSGTPPRTSHDADLPSQATMHMPAPPAVPVENAAWPDLDVGLPEMPVRGGAMPPPQLQPGPGGELPAIQRASNPIARSRSGLGQRLMARGAESPPGLEDDEDFAPPMLPAVGGIAAAAPPPPAGFTVAGGNSPQAAAPAPSISAPGVGGEGRTFGDSAYLGQELPAAETPRRDASEASPIVQEGRAGQFGTYTVGGGWSGGYTDEFAAPGYTGESPAAGYTGERYASGDDSREMERWTPGGHVAQGAPPSEDADRRPFSATQLGLPSLTSPALGDLPPSWQDVVGENAPSPTRDRERDQRADPRRPAYEPFESSGAFDGASSAVWSNSGDNQWGESRDNWRPDRPEETGDWSSVQPAASTWEESALLSAQIAAPDFVRNRSQEDDPHTRRKSPAEHDDFDDERIWTKGMTAVKPRGRLLRRVALFALLLLLFDMAGLVIARPDLCPNGTCSMVSKQIHQALPFLRTWSLSGTPALSADPSEATFAAVIGKQTTTTLVLTNTGTAPLTWQAAVGLPWLAVAPTTATIKPGATLQLTITAHPVSVKPTTYTSTVTLAVGQDALNIPVKVTVQAGPQLAVTPTTLSYASCGTTEDITIKNSGDSPLTFNAAPSQTDALALSAKNGNVAPGASSTVRVTLTCQATAGSAYTVNVTSNGGSATVSIQFG